MIFIRLRALIRLMILSELSILNRLMRFIKLTNFMRWFSCTVLLLKMLMKQIVKSKNLSTKSADSYLWDKNVNMISKIIFQISLILFRLFLIRVWILIILNLFWVDIIDVFFVILEIFCNMINSSRIKWL